MDPQILRDAIAKRIREKTGGDVPTDVPTSVNPAMQVLPDLNKDITPPKPDPEAMANSQIMNAVNRQPAVQSPPSGLTPEQEAIIKEHLNSMLAPSMKAPGPALSLPAPKPEQADPATLMQQQGKAMPSDDVQSVDLMKQFYKKKSQGL